MQEMHSHNNCCVSVPSQLIMVCQQPINGSSTFCELKGIFTSVYDPKIIAEHVDSKRQRFM